MTFPPAMHCNLQWGHNIRHTMCNFNTKSYCNTGADPTIESRELRLQWYKINSTKKFRLQIIVIPSVWLHWGPWGGVCDGGGWGLLCQPWPPGRPSAWHPDGGARPTQAHSDIEKVLRRKWLSEQIWECSRIWIISRPISLCHMLICDEEFIEI